MDIDPERAVRARADLLTAVLLTVFGLVIVYFSWTMPRLEARHIHPATIPGLVPLFLGIALTLCGALLFLRSRRLEEIGSWADLGRVLISREARRVGAVLGLALIYTLVLVGFLPFWAASMLFIFAFIVTFEVFLTDEPIRLLRSALWAAAIAIVAGGGIYFVFERIFLVRLP